MKKIVFVLIISLLLLTSCSKSSALPDMESVINGFNFSINNVSEGSNGINYEILLENNSNEIVYITSCNLGYNYTNNTENNNAETTFSGTSNMLNKKLTINQNLIFKVTIPSEEKSSNIIKDSLKVVIHGYAKEKIEDYQFTISTDILVEDQD